MTVLHKYTHFPTVSEKQEPQGFHPQSWLYSQMGNIQEFDHSLIQQHFQNSEGQEKRAHFYFCPQK